MSAAPTIIEGDTPHREHGAPRPQLLYIFLGIASVILISRGFYLQIVKGAALRSQAEHNYTAIVPLQAPRGIIFDSHKKQLVENIASTDVMVDPFQLSPENQQSVQDALSTILEIPAETITEKFIEAKKEGRITLLAPAISHEHVLRLQEKKASLPGIRLVSSSVRKYLYSDAGSHVLGYTSLATAQERNNEPTLTLFDTTGKMGIEEQYDTALRGKNGVLYTEVDAQGHEQKNLGKKDPVSGNDLYLTIDMEMQEFIYNLLAGRQTVDDNHAAAVIVLDPRTGAIRSLVSYPTFDPNVFSQPALRDEAYRLITDTKQPLFNRAISGTYPPGSTIKPVLAAGALQEGIITRDTTIQSTGGITIGPWFFPDWKQGGHGATTVTKAIAESVNTFFYLITGGNETMRGLGISKAGQYLSMFGYGKKTNIDIPTEAEGFIPSPEWKQKTKHEPWYIGDTYHLGIGQGDVLATPLQIALATSIIANEGVKVEPHLAESLKQSDGTMHTMTYTNERISIEKEYLDTVIAGMRQTITDGSARSLQTLPIPLAGKTGTAQVGNNDVTHAWFTSFAPYDHPELVVTVLLEKGGKGDQDAVPIAREIWQWWYENREQGSH